MRCHLDHQGLAVTTARQEGLWTRRQAREHGASAQLVRRRVAAGIWVDHGHGVFGQPGVPWTHQRRLWRGHLIMGETSVVSHEAAAVMHRMAGFSGEPVVLTRPHGGWSRVEGVTVHQLDDCGDGHRFLRRGLPVTTPARTIVDLSAVCGRSRLEVAVEEELARGRTTLAAIARVLHDVARPGKPGVNRLSTVLDRQVGSRPSASRLEWLMEEQLRLLRGVDYSCEVPLPSRGDVVGRVDFAIPACKVIIEVDGRRWHERRRDMIRDRDRDNAAAAAGWLTLRFMWEHLTEDPAGVRSIIEATCLERSHR
jgi:very-short-patch-repair endonuclease